jgi:hypothetical protein
MNHLSTSNTRIETDQDARLASHTDTSDQESMGEDRPIAIGGTKLG